MQYDVVIIGSGPSGTAAAMMVKQYGLKVIVLADISQSASHFNPAISHTVHSGVMELAKRLGLTHAFSSSVLSQFNNIHLSHALQHKQNQITNWNGYHICKQRLDTHLKETLLSEKGIELITAKATHLDSYNKSCRIGSSGGDISGKYVIDATGRSQFIGKKLKVREKKLSKTIISYTGSINQSTQNHKTNDPELCFNQYGWRWRAPDTPHSLTWTHLYIYDKNKQEIRDAIKNIDGKGFNTTWRIYRPLVDNHTILTGDAGGILDPAAGQGIFNALISGINAANCVAHCLNNPANSLIHQIAYDDWYVNLIKSRAEVLAGLYKDNGLNVRSPRKGIEQ